MHTRLKTTLPTMWKRVGALVVGVLAASVAACGDGSVSELDPGSLNTTTPTAQPTSDAGPGTDGGGLAGPSAQWLAFQSLASDLGVACGGACHQDGKGNAPQFLAAPDAYKAIRAQKGIVVKDVATSSILNKGRHEGPDLIDPLRDKVVKWLSLEAQLLQTQSLPSTDPVVVAAGANTLDLSKGGVAGVALKFNATVSGSILTLGSLKLAAPATSGVHIVFPVFVVDHLDGTKTRDTSFSNADQTFAAGQTATLNPGLLILTGWQTTDRLRVEFTKIETATVTSADGGTVGGGGCKSVATFTANAVPAIQQNGCLNCHNTGGSGNGALDLSALAENPREDAKACAQALTRANPQNPAQSDIILAPTGGVANHPFKNASANYAQMMQAWIANEK